MERNRKRIIGGALFLVEVDAEAFLWVWLALIVLMVVGFIAIAANMAKRVGLRRTCVFVEEDGTICFARYNAVYRLAAPKLAGAYRDVIDITYEEVLDSERLRRAGSVGGTEPAARITQIESTERPFAKRRLFFCRARQKRRN